MVIDLHCNSIWLWLKLITILLQPNIYEYITNMYTKYFVRTIQHKYMSSFYVCTM